MTLYRFFFILVVVDRAVALNPSEHGAKVADRVAYIVPGPALLELVVVSCVRD